MPSRRPTRLNVLPLEDRSVPAALILDPTFGLNGFAALPDAQVRFTKAAATPDGGTLFVGTSLAEAPVSSQIVLLKLTAAGAVDTAFGTAGRATLSSGLVAATGTTNVESFTEVVVLPDGRISVTGRVTATVPYVIGYAAQTTIVPYPPYPQPGVTGEYAVAYRLSAGGVLDATYDGDGKLLLGPYSNSYTSTPQTLVTTPNLRLLPDGGLVGVSGSEVFDPGAFQGQYPTPPGTETLYLEALRVTPSGAFDPTFDGDGKAKILLATNTNQYGGGGVAAGQGGVFVRPDGSVVFTLALTTATVRPDNIFSELRASQVAVAQLTPAGALDAAFGTGGRAVVKEIADESVSASHSTLTLVGLQPGGGALSRLDSYATGDKVLFRLSASGVADPSFGSGGTVSLTAGEVALRDGGGFEVGSGPTAIAYTVNGKPAPAAATVAPETLRLPSGNPGTRLQAAGGAEFLVGGTPKGPSPDLAGQTFVGRLIADPNPPVVGPGGPVAPRAAGAAGVVTLVRADGTVVVMTPFPGYTGEVRTAMAGGFVVVATGPGAASQVALMDAATGKLVRTFETFEASFTAGVFVAAADVNGDGVADVVVTPEGGGGPRVRVLNGATGAPLADFFGIEDGTFRGGARAVFADVNGDGTPDLAVVAAVGGGPRVAVYDGKSLLAGKPAPLAADFFAFDSSLRTGLTVAAGDFNTDGFADLAVTPSAGGGPVVAVFSGKELTAGRATTLAVFAQGDGADRTGARSTSRDINGDGKADLVVAAGGRVRGYLGSSLVSATPAVAFDLDPTAAAAAGVLVG